MSVPPAGVLDETPLGPSSEANAEIAPATAHRGLGPRRRGAQPNPGMRDVV